MPSWSNTPPATDSLGGIRLIRTPGSGKLTAVILSPDLIGCPTHYNGARTIPCEGKNCDLCTKGYVWRWHGYVGLWLPVTRERVLLELTAGPSQTITEHRQTHGQLRGFDLIASRPRGKANSRVHLHLGTVRHSEAQIPADPDVKKIMSYIWGYDPSDGKISRNIIGRSRIDFDAAKNGKPASLAQLAEGIGATPPETKL